MPKKPETSDRPVRSHRVLLALVFVIFLLVAAGGVIVLGSQRPVQPEQTSQLPAVVGDGTPVGSAPAEEFPTFPPQSTNGAATVEQDRTEEPDPALEQTDSVTEAGEFDGERALADVKLQVSLGPRLPGTAAHAQVVDWISDELKANGWQVEIQETTMLDKPVRNIIARCPPGESGSVQSPDQKCRSEGNSWIILGAHYDSRFLSDKDPDPTRRTEPVPGANDGASGVAVLLELARTLPKELDKEVWLVFFDAEDNGQIEDWDWILGSRAFAQSLVEFPDAVVIVDMVGDADLNLYIERNSTPALSMEIWGTAAALGYGEAFIPTPKWSILDDHTPFLQLGIPAVDIIDFDYPYWHTTGDTPDKVSAESLRIVGDTVQTWLLLR